MQGLNEENMVHTLCRAVFRALFVACRPEGSRAGPQRGSLDEHPSLIAAAQRTGHRGSGQVQAWEPYPPLNRCLCLLVSSSLSR